MSGRSLNSVLGALAAIASLALPVQADPNYDAGVKYYSQGNYRAACQSFESIELPNPTAKVVYYKALCKHQMKNTPEAVKLYQQLVTNYPGTQEAQTAALVLQKITGAPLGGISTSRSVQGAVAVQSGSTDRLPDSCTVPFHRGTGGHMLITAIVGGRQMEVMFDTGAAACYFGRDQLENAGSRFASTGQKTESMGVGGTVAVDLCMAEVQLGEIRRTIPLMVATKASMTPLLGQNFFNPFRYDIDTSAGVIHFYKKTAGSHESFDTMNVPFIRKGNELEVTVSVNGHETKAYFDTGAGCTMFSRSAADQLGLTIPSDAKFMMINGVGGGGIARRFRVDRVALGPVQKASMEIVVSESCPVSLIGQDFFGDKRFSIDNEANVIRFVH